MSCMACVIEDQIGELHQKICHIESDKKDQFLVFYIMEDRLSKNCTSYPVVCPLNNQISFIVIDRTRNCIGYPAVYLIED